MPRVVVIHHLERPHLGNVETLREAGLELEERHAVNGDPLPNLEDVDGLVVMGGMMSVADGADPLPEEVDLLRRAIDTGVPVLGICLGSQLLARAAGGEVRHSGRSIEWRELVPTEAAEGDPLFGALPKPVPALHWNEDVIEPPRAGPGACQPCAVRRLCARGRGAPRDRCGRRRLARVEPASASRHERRSLLRQRRSRRRGTSDGPVLEPCSPPRGPRAGAPLPAGLIDLIWNRQIDPGKLFDLELPSDHPSAGYQPMDQREAIKVLPRP